METARKTRKLLIAGIIGFKDTVVTGTWGACESMGEALAFLTAAIHWRKKQQGIKER